MLKECGGIFFFFCLFWSCLLSNFSRLERARLANFIKRETVLVNKNFAAQWMLVVSTSIGHYTLTVDICMRTMNFSQCTMVPDCIRVTHFADFALSAFRQFFRFNVYRYKTINLSFFSIFQIPYFSHFPSLSTSYFINDYL